MPLCSVRRLLFFQLQDSKLQLTHKEGGIYPARMSFRNRVFCLFSHVRFKNRPTKKFPLVTISILQSLFLQDKNSTQPSTHEKTLPTSFIHRVHHRHRPRPNHHQHSRHAGRPGHPRHLRPPCRRQQPPIHHPALPQHRRRPCLLRPAATSLRRCRPRHPRRPQQTHPLAGAEGKRTATG
jgi:hypothetical protein